MTTSLIVRFAALAILSSALCAIDDALATDKYGARLDGGNAIVVEESSRWCAAKGIWLVGRAHGLQISVDDVVATLERHDSLDKEGLFTLETIELAAKDLGLEATSVSCTRDWLESRDCLSLTIHEMSDSSRHVASDMPYHCLVYIEERGGNVAYIDPYLPSVISEVEAEKFDATWTGDAVLISKGDAPPISQSGITRLELVGSAVVGASAGAIFLLLLSWRRAWRSTAGAWAWGAIVGGSLLVAVGCSDASPAIVFDAAAVEYPETVDAFGEDSRITHRFEFENVSDADVVIRNVSTSCACTAVTHSSDPIPPGAQGEVVLTVDCASRSGWFTGDASVYLEGREGSVADLALKAFVRPRLTISPLGVDFGKQDVGSSVEPQLFMTSVLLDPRVEAPPALSVVSNADEVRVDVGPPAIAETGDSRLANYETRVSLGDIRSAGVFRSTLDVHISGSTAKTRIPVTAVLKHPTLAVEPQVVNFGSVPPGVPAFLFKITTADGRTSDDLRVEVLDELSSSVELDLKVGPGRSEAGVWASFSDALDGLVFGKVAVYAADRPERLQEVPFTGVIVSTAAAASE